MFLAKKFLLLVTTLTKINQMLIPATIDGNAALQKSTFWMNYAVAININVAPDKIWAILTNAADFPNWNSTVSKVEGNIELNQRIKVFAKINPDRAFPVVVSELTANKKMVWSVGMPLGLFKGIREFVLNLKADGSTDFSMNEDFSGLFVPMIVRSMLDLRPAFEDFAVDLKKAAEG